MLVVRDVDLRCFIELPCAWKLPQWVPTYPQKSFQSHLLSTDFLNTVALDHKHAGLDRAPGRKEEWTRYGWWGLRSGAGPRQQRRERWSRPLHPGRSYERRS